MSRISNNSLIISKNNTSCETCWKLKTQNCGWKETESSFCKIKIMNISWIISLKFDQQDVLHCSSCRKSVPHLGAPPGLGTQAGYEAPGDGDLWVENVKSSD